jgi:hypothetical protein
VVAIIPSFTDCQSQGKAITLASGKTIPMKCHWTGVAELALAVPVIGVGALMTLSRRREGLMNLSIAGFLMGAFMVALPAGLIGVCQTPDMICNTVMKPTLVTAGGIITALSLVSFVGSLRKKDIL